ncbi:M28 family peptidase [Dehalogenimonas sp. THU2]|uniref:M28 family metallopeptidase n=1 Tax=Dehalogenimonas sp. THU2 TaxID=3151121 RepID=UPI003218973D
MIEDGDFDIPSVYCADTTGEAIARHGGEVFHLKVEASRIPSAASNVIARKNPGTAAKVVVCAHIDTKETTPGAIDNASGIATLLLLAELMKDYEGPLGIEITAINGEDNYSAGGEMDYLRRYSDRLPEGLFAVNIDAAGYIEGKTCLSFYNLPPGIEAKAREVIESNPGLMEGFQWYQSDHMVFVQAGRPAIAVTSDKFVELSATITHTPKDTVDIVDTGKLVELAAALNTLIRTL